MSQVEHFQWQCPRLGLLRAFGVIMVLAALFSMPSGAKADITYSYVGAPFDLTKCTSGPKLVCIGGPLKFTIKISGLSEDDIASVKHLTISLNNENANTTVISSYFGGSEYNSKIFPNNLIYGWISYSNGKISSWVIGLSPEDPPSSPPGSILVGTITVSSWGDSLTLQDFGGKLPSEFGKNAVAGRWTEVSEKPPVAINETATGPANSSVTIDLSAGSTGSPTSAALVGSPTGGTVSITGTTATFTPDPCYNGQASPGFQFTLSNAAGTSNTATATVTVTNSAPTIALHFVSPFLLARYNFKYDLSDLDLATLYRKQNWSQVEATGLTADNTSAAIAVAQVNTCRDVTFSTNNGTILASYTPDFLGGAPGAGQSSVTITAAQLAKIGTSLYAAALVQAPAAGVSSFSFESPIAVTAAQTDATTKNSTQKSNTLSLLVPAAVFVHGLWGTSDSFKPLLSLLLANSHWGKIATVYKLIGYKNNLSFDDPSKAGGVDVINKNISEIFNQFDSAHIVSSRVDVVAHSMGGLVVRSYSGQSYYRSLRDRKLGQFHEVITLDTPEIGSALAGYLLQPKIANGTYRNADGGLVNFPEKVWQTGCGTNPATTVATCFKELKQPIEGGAVASLVPGNQSLEKAPQAQISGAVWNAISAVVPHPDNPPAFESAQQFILENLIAAIYVHSKDAPTISKILNNDPENDAIVTVASQTAGGPNTSVTFPGLSHDVVPDIGLLGNIITNISYANVQTSSDVAALVGCWLDSTCTTSMPASNGQLEAGPPPANRGALKTISLRDLHPIDLITTAPSNATLTTPFEVAIKGSLSTIKAANYRQTDGIGHDVGVRRAQSIRKVGDVSYISLIPLRLGRLTFTIDVLLNDGGFSKQRVTLNVVPPTQAPKVFVGDESFLGLGVRLPGYRPAHELELGRMKDGPGVALDPQVIYPSFPDPIPVEGFVRYQIVPDGHDPVVIFAKEARFPTMVSLRGVRPGRTTIEARFGSVVDRFTVTVER
jgi:hypothetical protein